MKAKIIFLILLAVIFTFTTFIQKENKTKKITTTKAAAPPLTTAPKQMEKTSIMDSPDGNMSLTLTSNTLFITSKSDGLQKQIFKKNSFDPEIPYNTWSPDNVYVFLKEKTNTTSDFLVFQSSGGLFSNNLPYLSIQELFVKNIQNYFIEDVTGWAAPNLLIVNTKTNDSDQRISFWFDVPSQSFIQLGTYFK